MILGIPKRILIIVAVLAAVGLIYVMGAGKRASEATGGSTGCKVTVTADVLNVRSAPDPNAGIVGKFNQNAQTGAEPVVQNGFRKLADNKWAKTDFLKPVAGNCG
ncbi:SH3 domain-containing protein [Amycolatopsis pithecellobii]|uniref:SH3 domain-containing protein n=1 Tax=Amycolatopsis pithecellobii TaxID=664692 RepID=A0A6N7Z6E8_9PSEU|nr:SH3 domain-containing protein [Amycolatopsis pithecellobii]MTD56320.1 SH3 domain-containing protein [Amycolatopsis pithecellobii]